MFQEVLEIVFNQLENKNFKVYGFSRNTNNNIISEQYLKNLSYEFMKQNLKIKYLSIPWVSS